MMRKWFPKWRTAPRATQAIPVKETAAEVVNVALFRDPPFREGLPVVKGEALLQVEPYSGMIGKIKKFSDWRNEEFDRAIAPAIEVMANYAGLLPASQSYHHNEGGGALLHALEVGYYAMRLGGETYYSPMGMLPSYRQKVNRRYQAVLFLAGLFHDIGKLFTDFTVATKAGQVWNPYNGSQVAWADMNAIERIYISWTAERHKKHEARYKGSLNRVIPRETIAWITDETEVGTYGRDLWQDLEDVLDTEDQKAKLNDFVIKADQQSTVGWMGVNPGSRSEGLAVPVDRYLLDLMREWVGSGQWKCNVKGARLWYVQDPKTREEKLFINWMLAVSDLSEEIKRRDIPGIPKDANRLADVLIQRSFAEPFQMPDGSLRNYWPFLPERLTKAKGRKKDRPEYGLCVRNEEHFLQSMRLPSIEKAEIGVSIIERLELNQQNKDSKAKNVDAGASRVEKGVAGKSPSPAKVKNSEGIRAVCAENAQQREAALSAATREPLNEVRKCAQSAPASSTQEVPTKETAPGKAPTSEAGTQASPTKTARDTEQKARMEKAVPAEWKQPMDWIKVGWAEDPSVIFVDGEDKCVDVELLRNVLGQLAQAKKEEEPALVHIRQAFAKEKVANLGAGMLGTVWVRRVNAEGNTVRAIWLQEDFYQAVQAQLQEKPKETQARAHEADDTPADKGTQSEEATTKSLTIEQEAQLCETALEMVEGEVSAGGKIRLRVEAGKDLLSKFGLEIEDLVEVKFATLQIWMSSGSLLIKRTDT